MLLRSKLERLRRVKGWTQDEMAAKTGIPIASYQRLERGQVANPRLFQPVNCAKALDVELAALIEDDWLEWHAS